MKKYFISVFVVATISILSLCVYVHHKQQQKLVPLITESEEVFQDEPIATTSAPSLHIPIFIYHSVRPAFPTQTANQRLYSITPATFEQQLQFLHDNGFTVISMDQLAVDVQNATTSGVAKPVVLTFDDGWENQYKYAFPLLKKYHYTGTFYIFTNPIGKSKNFLTWQQIAEMNTAGMTIGSHTLSHPYLSKITPDQLHAEVFNSKQILETHLGKPITNFASPFGYTSPALVALLKQAGYTTGRTTYKGAHHSQADILSLTGFLVHDDMKDFEWAATYSE